MNSYCNANELTLSPMQWGSVKDIDDTAPVGINDFVCLAEIRDTLKKHGMQNRFGVALLHSHLGIQDGEAFLEECDTANRVLHLRPVPCEVAENGNNIGTIFHLRDGEINAMSWCRSYCEKSMWFGHSQQHNVVGGK